jgi:hypothetical protein
MPGPSKLWARASPVVIGVVLIAIELVAARINPNAKLTNDDVFFISTSLAP